MALPPWLNIQPSDYLQAAHSGAQLGMQIAAAQNRAQEAAAARDLQLRDQAQRQWEFQENLRQRASELAASREESARRLDEANRYHLASVAEAQAGHEAQAAHWRQMEEAAKASASRDTMPREWIRDPNKEYVTAGGAVVSKERPLPTEYQTVTETIPAVTPEEARPAIPAQAFQKRYGPLGIDWLAKDIPATPAQPAIVPRGEQRITRRIPTTAATRTLDTFGTPYPPSPSSGTNVPTGKRVRVKSPEGKTGTVSEENLQQALDAGYTTL